jgi:hypothetical protein
MLQHPVLPSGTGIVDSCHKLCTWRHWIIPPPPPLQAGPFTMTSVYFAPWSKGLWWWRHCFSSTAGSCVWWGCIYWCVTVLIICTPLPVTVPRRFSFEQSSCGLQNSIFQPFTHPDVFWMRPVWRCRIEIKLNLKLLPFSSLGFSENWVYRTHSAVCAGIRWPILQVMNAEKVLGLCRFTACYVRLCW